MSDLVANLAVVPVLVGPLQVLLTLLPAITVAVFGAAVSLARPRTVWTLLKLTWRFKLHLIVVGLITWGVVWGWPRLFPPTTAASVGEAGADWSRFRGDLARTGTVPGGGDPRRGGAAWSFAGVPGAVYSSPAVVGNRVYFSSARPGIVGDGEGWLVCLDADTGDLVWKTRPDGYAATFSSPVVAGDRLVCGEGLHETEDARVVCLSLAPGEEGEVLWTFATDSHVESTPVVADGRVYIGAGDDGYYCLALAPDPDGEARVIWHLEGERYPDAETALAVHAGRVYAGLGIGGMAFCVLDAATGAELHRLPTGEPVFSPPSIAGDAVYFGSGFGDYMNRAEQLDPPQRPGGTVWCLGLADHAVRWKTPLPRTVLGAVAVKDGSCYAACRDGNLYRLDAATGAVTGRAACHAPFLASPAVATSTVYVVNGNGTCFGFDVESLERVWKYQLGSGRTFLSSPAVARGHVYVGTETDGLVCAGRPGAARAPLWTGVPAAADDTPLPAEGSLQWFYPPEQDGSAERSVITALPAALGDHLLVPLKSPCPPDDRSAGPWWYHLADLDPRAADAARSQRWLVRTGHVRHPPVALGTANGGLDRVVVSGDGLICLDGGGERLWSHPGTGQATGVLALDREGLYAQVEAGELARFTLDGERLWSAACPPLLHAPLRRGGLLVLVARAGEANELRLVDAADGTVLWSAALARGAVTAPFLVEREILVGTGRGLEVRAITDGELIWRSAGSVVGRPQVDGSRVWWIDAGGILRVSGLASGLELATTRLAVDAGGLLALRGGLLATDGGRLVTLSYADGVITKEIWSDDAWLGPAAAPPIAIGGRVFVPRPGWGLTCLGAE